MKTKLQKSKEIELGSKLLAQSKALIFTDFTGTATSAINKLKKDLKKSGAAFRVIKKRLLGIALKKAKVDFDPTQFEGQVGVVFSPTELSSVAGIVYKFAKDLAKEKKEFKLLGAYELDKKVALDLNQFLAIAKLPSREILLAMLVGVMSGPIRGIMYVMGELSNKKSAAPQNGEAKVAIQ